MAVRRIGVFIFLAVSFLPLAAQQNNAIAGGPTDKKAQKTLKNAIYEGDRQMYGAAIDDLKKADKQDGGHCVACEEKIVEYSIRIQDWNTATAIAQAMVADAHTPAAMALAHYDFAGLLMQEGTIPKSNDFYSRSHEELGKALAIVPQFPAALFMDGLVLARLKQDDAAKAEFQKFASMRPADDADRQRALLYISHPEAARERMAPPFSITTLDGQQISLDSLKGKVVLIDFWATWCGPCREALPHVREIAKNYQGQPFVVLSVNLDIDEAKWKQFVAKNKMTWPQYYDGGFTGHVATMFDVKAIPQTFTIDSSGVLQDHHIGDADMDSTLKKLVTRAQELQSEQAR
jgi:thiol-disulfide isomerase/thioredoxin